MSKMAKKNCTSIFHKSLSSFRRDQSLHGVGTSCHFQSFVGSNYLTTRTNRTIVYSTRDTMTENNEIAENGSDEAMKTENHCYVCWENSNEGELGELHRDCGCRGENGHVHMSCLITAKKAGGNVLETRSWLKCNQCQVPYADPTKRELIRAMDGDNPLRDRVCSTFVNLIGELPWLARVYTCLTIYLALYALACVLVVGTIVLLGPYVKRLYQTSSLEFRIICALLVGALCWKFRHPLYSFLRMYARQLARRAGREVYFNFFFAAEGLGANNLSTWTKVGAFAALVAIGYLRIRDRGTFDHPFHGSPRPHLDESRLRKMTKYLSFYTKEIGYWAIFDTYWTAVTILFLIGWAAYVFIVQRIIAVSLLTYENIYGETLLGSLKPFFDNHIVPWFKWVLQFPILDDFWLELDEERVNQIMQEMDQELENEQSEIARTHLDMDIIAAEEYIEKDPAVKRVMDDTREHNYCWCCM